MPELKKGAPWLILSAILLGLGGIIGLNLYVAHQSIDARERDHLSNQARIVHENLGQQLLATNRALDSIRHDLPFLRAQKDATALLTQRLEAISQAIPGLRTLVIENADGEAISSNRPELVGRKLGDGTRFQSVRKGGDPATLSISPPFRTPLGIYSIGAAKMLVDDRGAFSGIILAILEPEYFRTLLTSVLYAPDMRSSLIHGDGKVVFRVPDPDQVTGVDLTSRAGAFFTQHMHSGQATSLFSGVVASSGEHRLTILHTIRPAALATDKPLVIAVSRETEALFAPWRRDAFIQFGFFGMLALAAALALAFHQQRAKIYTRQVSEQENARRQADEALRESEMRFRSMADAAPVLIWVAAPDRQRTWFNQSWLDFTGRGLAQEIGNGWTEDIHPDDLNGFLAVYCRSFEWHTDFEIEYRLCHADGSYRWMLARGVPRHAPGGEFLGFIGCCTDITLRKTAEQQLGEARDAAEQASRAKSVFLANMSHEIRTPMSAILGMAHLMRRSGATPKQAAQLDQIDTSATHLLSIINDILDLSKIEAGKFSLEDADVAVGSLLGNIATILSPRVGEKGLRLIMDTGPLPLHLRGDPTRLTQALLNYANNAVKFTDQGAVTLRTRVQEDGTDEVLLRFEVEDTGCGIPPAQMARLFSAFEQGDASITRAHGGTGLGLAITRHLARLMDGEAGGSSTPGEGSIFWFTARLKKGKAPAAEAPRPTRAETPQAILSREYPGRRVLLAEDDPVNQTIAEELLKDAGLAVDVANNGAEALALAAATAYDLILMDMQMPKMDGLEAARRIRALPNRASVPILAMTANAFSDDRERCLAAGMNAHLAKPVMPEALFENVLKWLKDREM